MSLSKNLGQVSGVFIGKTPPINTSLIWYDDTPSQMCHKVFDKVANTWKALSPDIVSNITYSELVLNAQKNGLCIGKHYNITDKSNVLALAITATKVQYYDASGNILIDDLGTNIQYNVGSSNLLIDDLSGVFNTETNKLVFEFKEETDINIEDDYLFGKSKKNGKWFLSKFCFKSLISKKTDNSISWRKGIFFSLKEALNNMINKSSGVVGYDDYSVKMTQINKSITDISKDISTLNQNLSKEINDKTKDSVIYSKKIQNKIDVLTAPADVVLGDTLHTIISKFQRWINKFKYATGISISKNFADASSHQFINNNDTVESAFSKIQYSLKNIPTVSKLGATWIEYDSSLDVGYPKIGDTLEEAIRKIILKLRQIGDITSNGVTCNNPFSWTNKNLDTSSKLNYEKIYFQALNRYFSHLSYNQLEVKEIFEDNEKQRESLVRINSNGNIVISKREAEDDERVFDSYSTLQYDKLSFVDVINNKKSELTCNGLEVKDNNSVNSSTLNDVQLKIENENEYSILGFDRLAIFKKDGTSASFLNANSFNISERKISGGWSSLVFNDSGDSLLTSQSENMGYDYDAYFPKLKINSLNYDFTIIPLASNQIETYYIDPKKAFVLCKRGMYDTNIYLPFTPKNGTMIILNIGGSGYQGGDIFVKTQGREKIVANIIGDESSPVGENSITIDENDWGMRIFIYMNEYWHYLTMKG